MYNKWVAKIGEILKNRLIQKTRKMSKKIIGFDIGAYNIKAGIWNESLHTEIPSDATLISNDTFQHLTRFTFQMILNL